MKTTVLIIACMVVLIAVILLISSQIAKRQRIQIFYEQQVTQQSGDVLKDKILIELIENKQYDKAVRLLRLSMDVRVNMIWKSLKHTNGSRDETAFAALRIIRDFQKASKMSGEVVGNDPETQSSHDNAIAILAKIK